MLGQAAITLRLSVAQAAAVRDILARAFDARGAVRLSPVGDAAALDEVLGALEQCLAELSA